MPAAHSQPSLLRLGHTKPPLKPRRQDREASGLQEKPGCQGSSALGHTHLWVTASLPARNHRLGLGCPEFGPQGSRRRGSDLQTGVCRTLLVSTGPWGWDRGPDKAGAAVAVAWAGGFSCWELRSRERLLPACPQLLTLVVAWASHPDRRLLGGLSGLTFR